ncbi:hypothetical protein [Candidatus Methanoprimaticola sp. MG2]|uniref:hypothetical protein n=1 Tax=Candidatus Methanoprimaticola sp. MG2 TaxID=3228838 RepID=UPI0039C5B9C9
MATVGTHYGIPVDEDGHVPEEELLKHFRNVMAGRQREYDRRRREAELEVIAGVPDAHRMPNINLAKRDYDSTSDTVIPLQCTPEQVAVWWKDPTCCDVQDIDTAGPPKTNIPRDMTLEQRRSQGRIKVVATPSEEAKLRRELVMTYTPEDLRRIAETNPTIAVKPTGVAYSGRYVPSRTRIEFDRKDGFDQTTIAHEAGHLLRDRDPHRDDVITTRNPEIGIEESCTVAEQMARSDKPDYTGYYMSVAVYDERKHVWRKATRSEARRMAEEDHDLFTYGRGKGLKGDEALRSVEQNWAKSHIARLFTSRGMAVNVMAREYGNVEKVTMAKPRSVRAEEENRNVTITNATAGMPGVASANKGGRQITLFGRRGR